MQIPKTRSIQILLTLFLRMKILFTVLFASTIWTCATAQSSTCTSVLISLSPCLGYITGNSSIPPPACCQQLQTVVLSQPQCLCEVLNDGGSSLGRNINRTQALALPAACNVQTPPVSRCNSTSPTNSPSPPPPPGTPKSPSGGIAKAPPGVNSASGGLIKKPYFALALCLFTISYSAISSAI